MNVRRLALLGLLPLLTHPARAGELKGRILVGEKPAPGITVAAVPYESPLDEARREARAGEAPKALASVTTGASGAFTLPLTPQPGRETLVRLELSGGGLAPTGLEAVYDATESEDLGEVVVLAEAKKLAGRVVDGAGTAVAGAEVTLVPGRERNEDRELRRVARRTRTAADGTFRFEEASALENSLRVEKAGFATALVTGVRAGALGKPIPLAMPVELAGTVKRPDRRGPAVGALVRFEGRATTRWVVAGEDGSFRVPDAAAGRGVLAVDAGEVGYAELEGLRLPLTGSRNLAIVLSVPASIEGRAVDAKSSRALPRVKVELRSRAPLVLRTGPDGRYRLRAVPPGRYRLRADEPRYVPYTREDVGLIAGEAKKVDLPLTPGATLAGRVVDEGGGPVAGARGSLAHGGEMGIAAFLRQIRGGTRADFRTLPDGTFRATRLAPGENQRLTVAHPDYEATTLGGMALPAGGVRSGVSVVLRHGHTIAGVVKDKDGAPVSGAEIEMGNAAGFRAGRGGMVAQAIVSGPSSRPAVRSGLDGRFELKGLAPGDYSITVKKPGLASERVEPLKVSEAASPELLVVTLLPGAAIQGVVKGKSGAVLEGYFVQASAAGSALGGLPRGLGSETPTGPDGLFTIEGLKAGESYDLSVFGGAGIGPTKKGIAAPAGGVEITVAGTGRIAGRALDGASGRALTQFTVSYLPDRSGAGALGRVFRMAGRVAGRQVTGIGVPVQVSSEDGAFILEDVPAGKWQVVVDAKGYQQGNTGGVAVEEGATAENVEVRVTQGTTLRGRVTEASSGRPVLGASVAVEDGTGGAGGAGLIALAGGDTGTPTDADGRFEIEGLAAGKAKVVARHPDYTEASETVDLRGAGATVELHLTTGGAVGGAVLSETRQPLPGVDVSLSAGGQGGFGMMGFGGQQGAVTDAAGRFRFDHLSAGRYTVAASLRGKSASPAYVVLAAGESREDLALVLSAGATIHLTVSGLPAGSLAGVRVDASGPGGFFSSAVTGSDGRADVTGVPPGSIMLRATSGGFATGSRTSSKQVEVADGQLDVGAEIVFEAGYVLSGRVLKRGQPVTDASVFASMQGAGGRSATARTDEAGSYRLEGLDAGTYTVIASSGMLAGSARRDTVNLTGDQNFDIVFPAARMAGTVVEAGSRQPLPDAVVAVTDDSATGPLARSAQSDSSGRFALEDLDAKQYTVTVRKADFLFEKRSVTAAEQGTDDLTIELTRGEGIGVVGRDGLFGVPLHGLFARVTDAAGTPVFTGSVPLDSQGNGEIPSLKPGRYSLVVGSSGYATIVVDGVNVPSPAIPLALTPGGTLEIHAGPQTLSKGSAACQLLGPNGNPWPWTVFAASGQVVLTVPVRRLENLMPGSYTLVTPVGPKALAVKEGGTTLVELP